MGLTNSCENRARSVPDEIVCGRSLMMAEAALSNWMVSCRFGHVDVVVGMTAAGKGVHGVLELLLLLLCSDMLETYNSK